MNVYTIKTTFDFIEQKNKHINIIRYYVIKFEVSLTTLKNNIV